MPGPGPAPSTRGALAIAAAVAVVTLVGVVVAEVPAHRRAGRSLRVHGRQPGRRRPGRGSPRGRHRAPRALERGDGGARGPVRAPAGGGALHGRPYGQRRRGRGHRAVGPGRSSAAMAGWRAPPRAPSWSGDGVWPPWCSLARSPSSPRRRWWRPAPWGSRRLRWWPQLAERVRGTGTRNAVGALLTCPFFLALWVATAFGFGLVLAPRVTRFALSVLAAVAGADVLHFAYAMLQDKTDS